jgi:aminoglycoside 6'-N-acetyltransferase I
VEGHNIDNLLIEFTKIFNKKQLVFFIKYLNNISVWFAQGQLRTDYVEGTSTSPVGYLEGIFIKKEYRKKGYAKELLLACEKWAKSMGCTEFASDCELCNTESLNFHLAIGFNEANRIICFTKKI